MDKRIIKFAKQLVNYSCEVKKDENVLISTTGSSPIPLVKEIIKEVYKVGGNPHVDMQEPSIIRELQLNCNDKQLELMCDYELYKMKGMDAYIGIRAYDNFSELSDVPIDKKIKYESGIRKVLEERMANSKWVGIRYPNNSMAQLASMSLEEFENFYFNVCNFDYTKMSKAMDNIVELMNKTDKVKIIGDNTSLEFSIKNIPVVKGDGKQNIPDGEITTAPVVDSVNGHIQYNVPSNYQGYTYEKVYFEFKDGKIIKAESNNTENLNKILDTDDGSRFIGEFAIGVNPYITRPTSDILFDEKITGSFHFTPGMHCPDTPNGNNSKTHWDLVCVQTEKYGGGEIYFDDVIIRKNGLFVFDELKCLNPENLK